MSAIGTAPLMTTEELLALPEDGVDRVLIRGQLREKPMTPRGRSHSAVTGKVGHLLHSWLERQPEPHGEVYVGDAAFRLRRNPDTTVGIDVAYISAALADQTPWNAKIFDGVPVLAVEILSPSDSAEEVAETVEEYLAAGVALVWIINPFFRTVSVHRPGAAPETFNVNQELTAEPHLPGFRATVAEIFKTR